MISYQPFEVKPYVYLVEFPAIESFYVGSRYANVSLGLSPKEDLATVYKSSSNVVHALLTKGEKAVWTVLATCDSVKEASELESIFYSENSERNWLNRRPPSLAAPIGFRWLAKYPSCIEEERKEATRKMLETKSRWTQEQRTQAIEAQKEGWKKRTEAQSKASKEKRKTTWESKPPEALSRLKDWRALPIKEKLVNISYEKHQEVRKQASKRQWEALPEEAKLHFKTSSERAVVAWLTENGKEDNLENRRIFTSKTYGSPGLSNPNYARLYKDKQILRIYYPSKSASALLVQGEIAVTQIPIQNFFKDVGVNIVDYADIKEPVEIDISEKKRKTLSFNHTTGKPELKLINRLFIKPPTAMWLVTCEADASRFFEASENHAVYTRKGYETLKDCPAELELLGEDGVWRACKKTPVEKKCLLLDFEVEGNSNYFSGGFLSHNTPGGYAPKYYASWRGRITRIDDILEKGSMIGIVSKVRNTKNKIGIPKREAELQLKFATGFNSEEEYLNFLVPLGLVEQRGAWLYCEDWGLKVCGKDALLPFFKERPELFETVKNSINCLLAGETEIDKQNAKNASDAPEEADEQPPEE